MDSLGHNIAEDRGEVPQPTLKLLLIFLGHFPSRFVQRELLRLASLRFFPVHHDIFAGHQDFPDWLKTFLAVEEDRWVDFNYQSALEPLITYGFLRSMRGSGLESECIAWFDGERCSTKMTIRSHIIYSTWNLCWKHVMSF